MAKRVLVTGIGGTVGIGIIKSIRRFFPNVTVIGAHIRHPNAGVIFCDQFELVPYSYDPNFKADFLSIVERHSPDLIIPATDFESYYLPSLREELGTNVLASSTQVAKTFLDKYETYQALEQHQIPFAPSILPSQYKNQWEDIIVKPRQGRGSRNININPQSVADFKDDYLVQKLLSGPEITCSFYVTKERKLHGSMCFTRELHFGNTERCETQFEYDQLMQPIYQKLIDHFSLSGPCNVQCIVTDKGPVPFEINCRYSGTNLIRSYLGFEDVRYGIEEHLLDQAPTPAQPKIGSALRMHQEVIIPGRRLEEIRPGDKNAILS